MGLYIRRIFVVIMRGKNNYKNIKIILNK